MAAAAYPIYSLFRPSTSIDWSKSYIPQHITKVELLPHLTFQETLATGITWDDFCRFLIDKVAIMARGVYVFPILSQHGNTIPVLVLRPLYYARGLSVRIRPGTATERYSETCNFLVRLLATSEQRDLFMCGKYYSRNNLAQLPVSGQTLSHLFERSRETLIKVKLGDIILSEEHIRVLAIATATAPRQELQLILEQCRLSDNDGCRNAFVQWLQSGGGPTELNECHIDSNILADSVKGNSRLSIIRLPSIEFLDDFHEPVANNHTDMALIITALAENRSLTVFDSNSYCISDENWTILCQSLRKHPTLTTLGLTETGPIRRLSGVGGRAVLSDEQKTNRTRLVAEMMQTNTILHIIRLSAEGCDEDIYTESIQPRLEANLYRLRVLAVRKEAAYRPFRQKILGRALSCVRSNPSLVWMFLAGNVDAFVLSKEQEGTSNSEREVAVVVPDAVVVVINKRKRC
jgi:hypothetical protein